MFNDLHDHEWGGLPLMDGQAIPAGGVCGAFTVEAVRKTAAGWVGTEDTCPLCGDDIEHGKCISCEYDSSKYEPDYGDPLHDFENMDGPDYGPDSRTFKGSRITASYQVLDCEGKPVHKGDKLDEPLDGDGVVLDVFTGGTDGEVYVQWGNGTKTVVWGSEVRVASRRVAFNMGDFVTFNNGRHRPELARIREQKTDIDGNTQALIRFESDGEEEWVPFAMLSDGDPERDYDAVAASRRTARIEMAPADFDRCVDNGGKVRTINPSSDKYMHVCYDDEGSHSGEVKTKESSRRSAISGDVAGEEEADARQDDARVMESARLTEADSAYIMAGVATKHGDLGTFVRSASRNPAVYLRQAVYDAHGFTPTVREAMALWKWTANRVPIEEAAI